MITKQELKYYSSLLKKKNRLIEKKFIVEGEKAVLEGLNNTEWNDRCELLFISDDFLKEREEFVKFTKQKSIRIENLSTRNFEKISDTKTPQGVAAIFEKAPTRIISPSDVEEQIVVYLDNVSDPGNLGTILRNCDWFGINNILLSPDSTEYTNPKAIRASMGSVFHVNIYEELDINFLIQLKRDYKILCSDTKGSNIFEIKREGKIILIFSNEAHGPTKEITEIADKKITVPRIGKAESLNVASASAVILAQITK